MYYSLGISALYHDSAITLLRDGEIIYAAQEERFTRIKNDASFPINCIYQCFKEHNITLDDIDVIIFYDDPKLKWERIQATFVKNFPKGFKNFCRAFYAWFPRKRFIKRTIKKELRSSLSIDLTPPIEICEHHRSHAASAFFPSPYNEAAILCIDGVGEWATTSAWHGNSKQLTPLWTIEFPHSLGLLYSATTYFCGFKVNSGEYKLMGLAPYGKPIYVDNILNYLIDVNEDGTFKLNMEFFDFPTGNIMINDQFCRVFNLPPRKPESEMTEPYMNVAASIQVVTEMIVMRLANTLYKQTGLDSLCLAGGVALNCVATGKLKREGPFKNVWVQPAAGDAGGSLGAVLDHWYSLQRSNPLKPLQQMNGALLGSNYKVPEGLVKQYSSFERTLDTQTIDIEVAKRIAKGKVVGWYQGRSEFGPRALGNRSILADPRDPNMQKKLNLAIKFRESFRPFAPAVLEEYANDIFDIGDEDNSFMSFVCQVKDEYKGKFPSIEHVDGSARVQVVSKEINPRFYNLITEFYKETGCPLVINTSFNVRGEPIVETPKDALECFYHTEMDVLVLNDHLIGLKML
jgi:carbamoyltransferase